MSSSRFCVKNLKNREFIIVGIVQIVVYFCFKRTKNNFICNFRTNVKETKSSRPLRRSMTKYSSAVVIGPSELPDDRRIGLTGVDGSQATG